MLERSLAELCRGAEDLDPILHSFKDAHHLRVGVRDILGKDDIQATHAALCWIAEACLKQIAAAEYRKLVAKFGQPTIGEGPQEGQPSELAILALGKLGGHEPNYHSDLDLVFLYGDEGSTVHRGRASRAGTTTNAHFFSELGQRLIKVTSHLGPFGRLYAIDPRLRPTGRSGSLAVSIGEFRRYFAEGSGQLWERQALCKGRIIFGTPEVTRRAMEAVKCAAYGPPWQPSHTDEIRNMRLRLEQSASQWNLKRGSGGTVDIEFLVQMLQLKYGGDDPSVHVPGTLPALEALFEAGYLERADYEHCSRSYRLLRSVEARIRLMNATGRHELPQDATEICRLAYLLGYPDTQALVDETEKARRENRTRFERLFDEASR
jgi:glutamate-ammonia-ligase adenylyltransferase